MACIWQLLHGRDSFWRSRLRIVKEKKHPRQDADRASRNVLVPIDFSPASQTALRHALVLGGNAARLCLLHIISPAAEYDQIGFKSAPAARKSLFSFGKNYGIARDHHLRVLVRSGVPFQEILAVAKEDNFELIVLGVHDEPRLLGGIQLGHTVDRVSRYAHCPVLLVKENRE
jgi:nucleotide-binding universal stress UspA family protein